MKTATYYGNRVPVPVLVVEVNNYKRTTAEEKSVVRNQITSNVAVYSEAAVKRCSAEKLF